MMNANAEVQRRSLDPVAFHLTGQRPDGAAAVTGLLPALFAPFRDLTALRYDFPLVLVDASKETAGGVYSLTALIDTMLQKVAPPGPASEELRKMVLRLEREIRALLAEGATGTLSELWDQASDRLAETASAAFASSVRIARGSLEVDGPCLDCEAGVAARVVAHVWGLVQAEKAVAFRAAVSRLTVKLEDILRAEFIRSPAGRSADSLQASIGAAHHALIDFSALASLLPQPTAADALPASRRARIESTLAVLKGQRFFATPSSQSRPGRAPHAFTFATCAEALDAFRARLPEMVELVKALSIAEFEIDGAYVESKHDSYFARFDAGALGAADIALFPDYLVVLDAKPSAADKASLLDALSSGVPLKVVVGIDDVLEEGAAGEGHFSSGLRSAQIAGMAIGLGEVFVLQTASSNLYQMRNRLRAALAYRGPTLVSVFTGVPGTGSRYLSAAAAMESRAFPAFSYDPSAGANLAARFSLEDNPQADSDWTVQPFDYADGDLQRVNETAAFTLVDFMLVDPRYAHHFLLTSRADWTKTMTPMETWLAKAADMPADGVPYVWATDADDRVVRVVADTKAIIAARRGLDAWHRLQESGGVHNSHAERLLAREKAAWEAARKREEAERVALAPAAKVEVKPEPAVAAAAPAAAAAVPGAAAAPAPAEPARAPGEPYIETSRCSSCNECVLMNDKMFVYNKDKQAYIANPDAGTYRQLVEAAESCQVGVIHPGKPRNPGEPGLDDLMKRAESFN